MPWSATLWMRASTCSSVGSIVDHVHPVSDGGENLVMVTVQSQVRDDDDSAAKGDGVILPCSLVADHSYP